MHAKARNVRNDAEKSPMQSDEVAPVMAEGAEMTQARNRPKRRKSSPPDVLTTITLEAVVPTRSADRREITTEEAVAVFDLADARALRKWHAQGMPHRTTDDGRVVYPQPDVYVWVRSRELLMRLDKWRGRRGGAFLDMHEARLLDIEAQRAESDRAERRGEYAEPFLSVPLNREHPARETLLRIAAAGVHVPGGSADA